MAAAHLQNGRILRFLIVLGAVILTIFIYASYYSNIPLGIPPHIRTSSSALLSSSSINGNGNSNNNNHIEFDLFNGNGNKQQQQQPFSYNESNATVSKKNRTSIYNNNNNNSSRHHHYQHQQHQQQQQMSSLLVVDGNSSSADNNNNSITNITNNAIGDGELSSIMSINLNERNQSKVNLTNFNRNETKSVMTTNNTAHFNASKINKTKEEEEEKDERMHETRKHVPPSSLQKLIQNADKVLSNLTAKVSASAPGAAVPAAAAPPAPAAAAAVRNPLPQQQQSSVAQPPSAVMPANRGQPSSLLSTTNGGGGAGVDTTQGIPTKQIYESGHMDGVNPMLCPNEGKQLKLLILITSAETHREARKAIRRTWGSQNGTATGTGTATASPLTNEVDQERSSPQQHADFAIAFMLGRSTNTTLEMQLEKENQIHGDLIRGHFIDSYNNLTLKTISAIEWVDRNCQHVKHILKTDDDMFINVAKLMKFLDKHQKEKRIIYGRLARKWKPIRNRKSKYFVSIGQFSSPTFPTFTTGPAYVMSSDIIHDLYVRSLQQTYLKLEDVFMTGIIAQQLGIKRVHINEFRNQRIAFTTCSLRKAISVHMVKPNEQFDLWKKLQNRNEKCK